MRYSGTNHIFSLIVYVLYFGCARFTTAQDENFYEKPGFLSEDVIAARGFKSETIYLTSADGYRLKLIKAWNPNIDLLNTNRVPILFAHGILEDSNCFLVNSFGVKPRDLRSYNLLNASQDTLDQLAREPSSKSLPFLAMNMGHIVWLLNRRGAPGSRSKFPKHRVNLRSDKRIGVRNELRGLLDIISGSIGALYDYGAFAELAPFSFDKNFWNYSFDEQAWHDFPMVIEYVSERSFGSKVAIVSHSAGGAILLMALAHQPELESRISSAIFWSEGFSLGFGDTFHFLRTVQPILELYIGSVPPAFSTTQIQAILDLFCIPEFSQRTLCESVADLFLGQSGGQEPIKPQFINSILYPTSSHELAQNLQNTGFGGYMHMYDHGTAAANQAAYGESVPPLYDLSRVQLDRMSFYVGRTDFIVTYEDVKFSSGMLKVPYNFHLINTTFNHQSYFYHDDNSRLVIIPSLKEIQAFSS